MPDATGWTAIIALGALILSQLPPVGPWIWRRLKGPSVLISTKDTISFAHYLGRLWVVLYMQIENNQSVPVAVSSIECIIRPVINATSQVRRPLIRLVAQSYFTGGPATADRLFVGTIRLQPNQHWQEVVNFLTPTDDQEDEEVLELGEQLSRQIQEKWEERQKAGDASQEPVEVDDELVVRATEIFNRRFNLTRGEYEMFLAARDRDNRVLGVTKFRFILYDGMIRLLREVVDNYKFGWGISVPVAEGKRWPEPRLILVGSGKDVKEEFEQIVLA